MSSSLPKRQSGQLSTIESSVTRLLVATKKLLEGLTLWAKHAATETDISDHYVSLGNEFKVACRAFSNAGVDVSDLGDVPHSLRLVLEEALCEEPSQESLDKFLPIIREIIVDLLQNLKAKQATVKQLQLQNTRSVSGPSSMPIRSPSEIPTISEPSQPVDNLDEANSQHTLQSPLSTSNTTATTLTPVKPRVRDSKDALSQLQNGDYLRRRASKRFSAYQYAKLANFTPERDSDLPVRISSQGERTPVKGSPLLNNGNLTSSSLEVPSLRSDNELDDTIQVYLKIGQRVKKVQLSGSLTTASLRLLFVEKFAYSPGGSSFPDIYIQDPNSNVAYELENLTDIRDDTVISLHEVDSTNAGWKNLEPKINTLTTQVAELQLTLASTLKDVKESAKQATPEVVVPLKKTVTGKLINPANIDLKELDQIKRDLSVIRQTSYDNKKNFKESMNILLEKVRAFKETGYDVSESTNRMYMESCRTKLSKECEHLLTSTDDLQDVIEALRKDVAQRRARPPKKQIAFVAKELQNSKLQLDTVNEYITVEKQNWKKIWESELNTVCEEQQFFNLQEELVMDLQDDLERAFETFQLVEECTDQLSKNPNVKVLPNLPLPGPGENLNDIREHLLSEVVALNPNHEGRVVAIEKAERLRELQREISSADNFQEELGGFVEGKMLKKSGGIEETERLRELQNRENLGFLD